MRFSFCSVSRFICNFICEYFLNTTFLLPSSAVEEAVRGLGKGLASRTAYWVFDGATEQAVRAEERAAPGSQTLTYADVVWVARQFGTGYKLTVSRLLGLGLIAEADRARLLGPKSVALARECLAVFAPDSAGNQVPQAVTELSGLGVETVQMAIEAYRRRLIIKIDLAMEALSVPGLSEAKLLEFAEAAR